uniref:Transmembrane protein n=1 Tax=Panagrolaimus sp. PS1159 TaxID=55785 RepID=A0AC35FZ38_9BILA
MGSFGRFRHLCFTSHFIFFNSIMKLFYILVVFFAFIGSTAAFGFGGGGGGCGCAPPPPACGYHHHHADVPHLQPHADVESKCIAIKSFKRKEKFNLNF